MRQVLLAVYAVALLGAFAMVAGPFMNDRSIAVEPGRALATVTNVGWLRTSVDFQDAQGIYHSPPTGLIYPTGLGEGQKVWVTYKLSNPDLVKVEGREWTLSIIPALSVAVVASLIFGLAWRATSRKKN